MTYEYVCTACQNEWEASQPISAPALKVCPKCGESTARRQISGGTGFVLKGGGWYSDLYSSSRPATASSAEGSEAAPKAASSETKATPAASAPAETKVTPPTTTGSGTPSSSS